MRKDIKTFPFILLLIGTFGLLFNEFCFKWGRMATLLFAVANIIGLFILGFICLKKAKDK